ncbi:MAG: hypothetical protein QW548_01650 [Candidatus Aenigmatarchaeota archaeon]
MEHLSELLLRHVDTFSMPDPYAAAHNLMHWAARFGRVVERENKVLTTGPQTATVVKFYIERKLDNFTHLHIAFDLVGSMPAATLSVVIEATIECTLPTTRGIGTAAFRDVYLARLWPAHFRLAHETAKETVDAAQQNLAAQATPQQTG